MWGMFYEFKESANGKGWAPKIILWLLSIELNMKAIKLMDNKCIRFMYIYIYINMSIDMHIPYDQYI